VTTFTVVIPTHDHGDTLRYAVRSVQWQTVQDFEIFIVGDGVPERTREIVRELIAADSRIRFFDCPKGARLGEMHRHAALAEARGRFVCYQADDDLWFPDHLEAMASLLDGHDLAHCMQIDVAADGRVSTWMFDAKADSRARVKMQRGDSGFGLASGGHRLDAYRRLPRGWNPAPVGMNTDLHFWLQFLEQPWCRYVSSKWPRVMHFSSIPRKHWDARRRVEELADWWERIQTAADRERLVQQCLLAVHDQLVRESLQSSSHAMLAKDIARRTKSLVRGAWKRARRLLAKR